MRIMKGFEKAQAEYESRLNDPYGYYKQYDDSSETEYEKQIWRRMYNYYANGGKNENY
jgi:DNA invertase Pin-like site-specific DNA recombinase